MIIIRRITVYLEDNLDLDKDNVEVIEYSLELIIHTLISTILVLIASWLLGSFKESVIVLSIIFLLRSFSGGAHCSSAYRCTLLSVLIIPLLGFIAAIASNYFDITIAFISTVLCFLLSAFTVFKLAPVDSPNKPITSPIHIQRLRFLSFLFLIFLALLQFYLVIFEYYSISSIVIAINLSVIWQAFMLTKIGHVFIGFIDLFFIYAFKKRG